MKETYLKTQRCSCGKRRVLRKGRYGYFWGCESFPKCKETLSIFKGEVCPKCSKDISLEYDGKGNYRVICDKCNIQYTEWREYTTPRYFSSYYSNGWSDETWHEYADWAGIDESICWGG